MSELHGFYAIQGGIGISLDPAELGAMNSLLDQLEDLVRPAEVDTSDSGGVDPLAELVGIDDSVSAPQDKAVARLFPNAYREDDDAASEFRRFTERGLRDKRMVQFETLRDVLVRADHGPTALTSEESAAVLGALNDLRLVLGTRLGIEEDSDNREDFISPDDPGAQLFAVYQWLTWLQSQFLEILVAGS